MKKVILSLLALSIALVGLSCSKIKPKVITVGEEVKLGAELKNQMDDRYRKDKKLVGDVELLDYIRGLGATLLSAAPDARRYNFTFSVFRDSKPQAFSLPGGHVYISTGVLTTAENEAELAAALSREIAHVNLRHPARELSRQGTAENIQELAEDAPDKKWAKLAAGEAARVAGKGGLMHYNRKEEEEADRVGAEIMKRAGYDPYAMLTWLRRYQEGDDRGRLRSILSREPSPRVRQSHLSEALAKMGRPGKVRKDSPEFQAARQRVQSLAREK